MNWKRYYTIVISLVVFVLGVHIFTANQLVDSNSRHKRSTNPLSGGVNSTLLHNTSDPLSTEGNSTSLPVVSDTLDVTDSHLTTDTTKPNQDPSQTSTISLRNSLNETSTKVPNTISDQNVTEENAQNDTAENTKVSVINTTLSTAKESRPHDEVTTPHVGATSEDRAQSSDSSVFVVPQAKVPFVSSSAVLSTVTTAAIFETDDGEDLGGSLNLLAIVLPIAIFLLLVVVLVACICCCKRGILSNCCPKGKSNKRKKRKDDGNDLWAEDGGIDNTAVINDEEFHGEKGSEVDSVVISAQSYGGKLYEVDYGFEASEESHLPLAPGSVVEVVEKLDSGWWRGYVGDSEGWFPATYVHTLDRQEGASPQVHSDVIQGFDIQEELNKLKSEEGRKSPIKVESPAKNDMADISPVSLQDKLKMAISQEIGKNYKYIAMADYEADNSDELSISKGESLAHLNKDPGGWTRVKRDNTAETGWVPSTYIQQISEGDDMFLDNEAKMKTSDEEYYDDQDLDETVDWEAEFDEDHDELTGIEHRAIHPYTVQKEGDLSFERGETVIVFEMLANGWWRGCSNGQEGWFPATYVEAVGQTPRENDNTSQLELSLVPQSKRVSIHMENNIEYPDSRDSSLERRMLADQREKEKDPLYSPSRVPPVKPEVPVRFVTPKLVRVNRGTLKRSAHRLKRPRRPAPAPPAGVEPYRTLTKHSLPRRKRKPPPPPKRTCPPKAHHSQRPIPPQRTVPTKLMIPKNISSSSVNSPQSPGDDPEVKSIRFSPTRPAPPAPSVILEARKQSIASVTSTGSVIPPPPMFMNTMQKEREETETKKRAPPKPVKRVLLVSEESPENDAENLSMPAVTSVSSTPTNSLDRYASIDSKDSGSSWGHGSSLDKKDRPVMAVKPVMKFVQSDAWKQDIKRTSSGTIHSSNSQDTRPTPAGQESTSGPVSPNTMRVAPQPQSEQRASQPKTRPNPAPRKSISNTTIPLHEILTHSPPKGRLDSRPSTSSSDSGKPAPPRPPPPRPAGPPPPPQHDGVEMRKKNKDPNNSYVVKRKSTLRRAAQSYRSAEKGHLNFDEDSFIKELGEVPGKPGWMLGMLADGTTGIYPSSRVEQISQGVRVSRV